MVSHQRCCIPGKALMATEQRREELVRISLTCKGGTYNPPLWEYVWKTGRLDEFPRLQGFGYYRSCHMHDSLQELKSQNHANSHFWETCWKQVTPFGFMSVQTSNMLLASDSWEGLIVEQFVLEKAWCKIPSLAALQARRFAGLEEQVAQLSQEKGNPLLVVMEFIQPNSCTTLT